MTDHAIAEAGWYPDPARPSILRWWTGSEWTESTHPIEASSPPHTREMSNPFPELESSESATVARKIWPAVVIVGTLLVVIVGALAALTTALNKSNLDTAAAQAQISSQLTAQFRLPISVTCPAHVPLEKGGVFECTASDDKGYQRTVRVTQTTDSGDITFVLEN